MKSSFTDISTAGREFLRNNPVSASSLAFTLRMKGSFSICLTMTRSNASGKRKESSRPQDCSLAFIAPAWLLSPQGEQAARDAGMEYTTRLLAPCLDLRSGQSVPARSLVYSVRNRWRRSVSRAWNRALFQTMTDHQLLRLSIHPPDYHFPEIWSQIERLIGDMTERRTPTTYRDWIAEQRLQSAA